MDTNKIKEVFSDEAFAKSLFELETATEVQTALMEKGIDMSEDEINAVHELLVKLESGEITQTQLELFTAQIEEGVLSEDALKQVAGGCIWTIIGIGAGVLTIASILGTYGWIVDRAVQEKTGHHW